MRFKESETLELKRSTAELKAAVVSVCAILNKHKKGKLYFGIRNGGEIIGLQVSEQTLRDVSRAISDGIEPRVYPRVQKVRLSGKDCIKVEFTGEDAPYFAGGRAYIRVGDEDRQLSARELEKMVLKKHRDEPRWEEELSGKKLSSINTKALKTFVRKANLAGRIDYEYTNAGTILNKLGLITGEKLRRAAEVLFCDDSPLEVQAAVFAGTDKRTFLDIKQFEGTLFDLLQKAETYVKEHIDWRVEFGRLERTEIPEVPMDALREALVNSLCHRDYRNPKGNEVAIFRDRVEIYNPGDFPEGYKPEDFIKGEERSILRNPLIAEALFKSKDIERWGSGLKRIADECAERGVKVEFKVLKSGFLVTFFRPAELWGKPVAPQVTPQATPQVLLTGLEIRILAAIRKDPKISRARLAEILDIRPDTVKEYLGKLKGKGVLRRVGKTSGGHWEAAE